ncbi:MAG TPA: hypothetical protein VL633_10515 [Bacteroidota bacterium]|nr:hypothetical protein [Bacteroidota bacterium]
MDDYLENATLHSTTNSGTIRRIAFANLPRMAKLEIMWEWFWRSMIVTVVALIVAMIVGFFFGVGIGLFLVALKIPTEPFKLLFQVLGFALGLATGFLSLNFLIAWLTRSQLGAYELWLVQPAGFEIPASEVSNKLTSPDTSQRTPSSISHNSPDPASW